MTQMSSTSSRSLVNAISDPSGDHSGNASNAVLDVSCTGCEQCASSRQMAWRSHEMFVVKAIWVPSGDHAGHVSWATEVCVSRVLFEPSASITQISQLPNSFDAHLLNAICVPVAFQSGKASFPWAVCVILWVPVESGWTTQMSLWPWVDRPNAISPLSPGNAALAAGPVTNRTANKPNRAARIVLRFMTRAFRRGRTRQGTGLDLGRPGDTSR